LCYVDGTWGNPHIFWFSMRFWIDIGHLFGDPVRPNFFLDKNKNDFFDWIPAFTQLFYCKAPWRELHIYLSSGSPKLFFAYIGWQKLFLQPEFLFKNFSKLFLIIGFSYKFSKKTPIFLNLNFLQAEIIFPLQNKNFACKIRRQFILYLLKFNSAYLQAVLTCYEEFLKPCL